MDRKQLVIDALRFYALHCGAEAAKLKQLGDAGWEAWAERGMTLQKYAEQLRAGELYWVEQGRLV